MHNVVFGLCILFGMSFHALAISTERITTHPTRKVDKGLPEEVLLALNSAVRSITSAADDATVHGPVAIDDNAAMHERLHVDT